MSQRPRYERAAPIPDDRSFKNIKPSIPILLERSTRADMQHPGYSACSSSWTLGLLDLLLEALSNYSAFTLGKAGHAVVGQLQRNKLNSKARILSYPTSAFEGSPLHKTNMPNIRVSALGFTPGRNTAGPLLDIVVLHFPYQTYVPIVHCGPWRRSQSRFQARFCGPTLAKAPDKDDGTRTQLQKSTHGTRRIQEVRIECG